MRQIVLLASLLSLLFIAGLRGENAAESPPHVRIVDPQLRHLFREGLAASLTLRALAHRIDHSDVVVYLRAEGHPRDRLEGRLQFIGAAGGLRYLLVNVSATSSHMRRLALIGHELQHAAEVADAPHVIDARSLEQEYRRIGYPNRMVRLNYATYETCAAVRATELILKELVGRTAPGHVAAGTGLAPAPMEAVWSLAAVDDD